MSNPATTTYSYTQTEDMNSRSGHNIEMDPRTGSISISSKRSNTKSSRGTQRVVATAMHNLKRDCLQLKKYSDYKKTDLPEDIFKTFLNVSELATQVGGTEQYSDFYAITSDIFADVESKGEGTVADFFIGCENAIPRTGSSVGCEVQCAGNLPIEGYTTEDFCDTHVAIHSGSLSITYSPADKTDTIRIYHSERDVALTAAEVTSLQKKGINNAILTYTGGSVSVTSDPVKVSTLLRGSKKLGSSLGRGYKPRVVSPQAAQAALQKKDREDSSSFGSGAWIIAAIIFFIIIIVIIYVVVYSCGGTSSYGENTTGYGRGYTGEQATGYGRGYTGGQVPGYTGGEVSGIRGY